MSEPCKLHEMPAPALGTCYVVKVGNRFFCGWDRSGRVQTAWSIVGAVRCGCFYGDALSMCKAIKVFGKRRFPRRGFSIARVRIEEVSA